MKKSKIIIVLLITIILFGCSKEEPVSNIWPTNNLIEYTSGNIVSVKNENVSYEIKIDNTTEEEYNNYIDALKTVSYYEVENNNNIWKGNNNSKYVSVEYIPTESNTYVGYNVEIKLYNSKPESW